MTSSLSYEQALTVYPTATELRFSKDGLPAALYMGHVSVSVSVSVWWRPVPAPDKLDLAKRDALRRARARTGRDDISTQAGPGCVQLVSVRYTKRSSVVTPLSPWLSQVEMVEFLDSFGPAA